MMAISAIAPNLTRGHLESEATLGSPPRWENPIGLSSSWLLAVRFAGARGALVSFKGRFAYGLDQRSRVQELPSRFLQAAPTGLLRCGCLGRLRHLGPCVQPGMPGSRRPPERLRRSQTQLRLCVGSNPLFENPCRYPRTRLRPPASQIAGPASSAYASSASGPLIERQVAIQYALAMEVTVGEL